MHATHQHVRAGLRLKLLPDAAGQPFQTSCALVTMHGQAHKAGVTVGSGHETISAAPLRAATAESSRLSSFGSINARLRVSVHAILCWEALQQLFTHRQAHQCTGAVWYCAAACALSLSYHVSRK